MLSSENTKIRGIAANWIIVMFDFNDSLLQFMFKSEFDDVITVAKKWFMKEKDNLGFYIIKKQKDDIQIMYEGVPVNIEDFPQEIVLALSTLDLDMDLEAQKVYLTPETGWQLVVHNVSKIADNSLRHVLADVNERGMMLMLVSDYLGWDNMERTIVSNDIFQAYLVTSV